MATSCTASWDFSTKLNDPTSQGIMEETLIKKFPILRPKKDYVIEGTTPNHEEQYYCVKYKQNKTLLQVDQWYLISSKWFNKWESYVGYETWLNVNAGKREFHPGPVDNGPLVDCYGEVRRGISEVSDYKLITEEVWEYLLAIYGCTGNTYAIPRKVLTTGSQVRRHFVEVRPIDLGCHREISVTGVTQFRLIRVSRSDTMEHLKSCIHNQFDIPKDEELILRIRKRDLFYKLNSDSTQTLLESGITEDQQIFVELKKDGDLLKKEGTGFNGIGRPIKESKPKSNSKAPKKLSANLGIPTKVNKHLKIRKSQSHDTFRNYQWKI